MVDRPTRAPRLERAAPGLATDERLVERRAPDGTQDPVARSAYVRRYESEFAGRSLFPVPARAIETAALDADLVLLGEYHPLPGAAAHAEALLRRLARAGRPAHLGVEFAQGRDQATLDAFLAGAIDSDEVRERIAWEREWGYPWAPARRLLERARTLRVAVDGLDVAPRGGARDLGIRDRVVASRLARRLERGEGPLVVVFGEAHLANAHLPAALARELGEERAESLSVVRVLHDLPAEGAPQRGSAWAFDESTFVTYPAGPLAREGALARVWRRWAASRPSPRLEQEALLHALARMQLDALGLDSRRARLPGGGVLADLFPRLVLVEDAPAEQVSRVAGCGALYVEDERVVVVSGGSVNLLARGAGDFCASALASRASPRVPRRSSEGGLLLACIGEALARLADPVTEGALREREDDFARDARVPDSPEQARLLGGALGRLALRGRFPVRQLARAARRAHAGPAPSRKALKGLATFLV